VGRLLAALVVCAGCCAFLLFSQTDVDCERRHRILATRNLEVVHCGAASPPAAFFLSQLAVLLRDFGYFRSSVGNEVRARTNGTLVHCLLEEG
jgi:hypothetical protein